MKAHDSKAGTTRFVNLGTYAANRPVEGEIITVLDSSHDSRGLLLMPTFSRGLRKNSIHELIATDEADKKPGETVNRIAYLAFFEVTRGGCVIIGEKLVIGEREIGTVLGYDDTHEPNHINIVISVKQRQTGGQLGLALGQKTLFKNSAS